MAPRTRLALPATVLVTTTLLTGCIYVNEAPDCVSSTTDAGETLVRCRVPSRLDERCVETRLVDGGVVARTCETGGRTSLG